MLWHVFSKCSKDELASNESESHADAKYVYAAETNDAVAAKLDDATIAKSHDGQSTDSRPTHQFPSLVMS